MKKFTLIELMMVVVIFLILVALLLPVLSRAKNKARDVECVSHINQNMAALIVYASDNDAALPTVSKFGTPQYARFSYSRHDSKFQNLGHLWDQGYIDPKLTFCPQANASKGFRRKKYQFYLKDKEFDPYTRIVEDGIYAVRQAYILYPYEMSVTKRNELKIRDIEQDQLFLSDGIWEAYHTAFDPSWAVGKIDGSVIFHTSFENFEYRSMTKQIPLSWSKAKKCREKILNKE